MRQQRVEEAPGRGLGMRRLAVQRFGRVGVRLEPVEQLGAVAGDHVELRAVHMGVDEAGQHQPAAMVDALPVVAGRLGLEAGDAVALDQQPMRRAEPNGGRVRLTPGGRRGEIEQVAEDGDAGR